MNIDQVPTEGMALGCGPWRYFIQPIFSDHCPGWCGNVSEVDKNKNKNKTNKGTTADENPYRFRAYILMEREKQ